MSYVIMTMRSLGWMLLSLLSASLMLAAIFNPAWLVGAQRSFQHENETIIYTTSVGVYTKCGKPITIDDLGCTAIAVQGLATDSIVFPLPWKLAMILLSLGLTIMTVTVMASVISCCVQSCFKKSIISVSGSAQAVAGICFILGGIMHPIGWGAPRVMKLCGREASPFYPGNCSLGMGLFLLVIATFLTFVSACISVFAEKATSSDKIQDEIDKGKTLICLP